jgi:hypothetical protein
VPRLCEFYPGICITTGEKAWKNLSQGSRRVRVYMLLRVSIAYEAEWAQDGAQGFGKAPARESNTITR